MALSSYAAECARSPDIAGWDAQSLRDFDRMWFLGVKQWDIAAAFDIERRWVNVIRRRRRLPNRCLLLRASKAEAAE